MSDERVPCIELEGAQLVHLSERCPAVVRQSPENVSLSWWSQAEVMDCPSLCGQCWRQVKFVWTGERSQGGDLLVWADGYCTRISPNEAMKRKLHS